MKAQNTISHSKALDYMRAGKAIMTIESKLTNKHFTFKFVTPKHDEEKDSELKKGKDLPIWVRLLNGPDNDSAYTFLGTIFNNTYYHSKKSHVGADSQAVKSFKWWLAALVANDEKRFKLIELYHEGRCMKCGRRLTTPQSVEQGVGPVCADWIERQKLARDKKIRFMLETSGIDINDVSEKDEQFLIGFLQDENGLWK
ncbi:MAG: DUF6011 domain-containing protein [Candidatus Heimdallarchaeota archaeon]